MIKTYGDFCPLVHRMLDLVPDGEVIEWKLRVHAPLATWIDRSVALVGDASHLTLPHLNQGAAQAIEDAAVIAVALSHLPDASPKSINKALLVYEKIRKNRAETLVALAAANGKALQLGEGEAQKERDKAFAALKFGNGSGPSPDKSADAEVQKMINGFDCVKVTQDKFDEVFQSL
jgi:salicylate hydroxylase